MQEPARNCPRGRMLREDVEGVCQEVAGPEVSCKALVEAAKPRGAILGHRTDSMAENSFGEACRTAEPQDLLEEAHLCFRHNKVQPDPTKLSVHCDSVRVLVELQNATKSSVEADDKLAPARSCQAASRAESLRSRRDSKCSRRTLLMWSRWESACR